MAEKKPPPIIGIKPVPMKLFATWEVDRTPPNCIPRLCSLSLSRLVVLKNLGSDLVSSIVIAVKMQNEPLLHPDPSSKVTNKLQNQVNKIIMSKGSKRTLRSHELVLPPNGLLDTELELNFSLQYPHFLKRDGNKLHIMLQRRKRYKNRTILGYKTLAEGIINMSQVLQRQMDMELDLVTDGKESKTHNNVVARVTVNTLSSQPVDHEGSLKPSQSGRGEYSDEEEDFSSNDEGSDSEPMLEEPRIRKTSMPPDSARQRNLKQKFISLLKRFRVNEDLQGLDTDREAISSKLSGGEMDPADIEDLFEELEDMSDSGPEMDTMSISSTPKPSLRPFFSSSRSLLHEALNVPGRPLRNGTTSPNMNSQLQLSERGVERLSDESSKKADSDSHPDSDPAPTASSPPKSLEEKKDPTERERKSRLFARDRNSSSGGKKKPPPERTSTVISPGQIQPDLTLAEPRKVVMEQLVRVLSTEDWLPEQLSLVNTGDPLGALIASRLQEKQHKVICTAGSADVKATVSYLVNKIQKFCNTSAKPPSVIKLLLAGSDSYVNCVLRHYVEQLSLKPPDWQSYIRFLVVPLGNNTVSRYLGSLDAIYNSTFASENWKETIDKGDANEVVNRIQRYLQSASFTVNLPIAEAMLTYKEKSSDDESSQIFIPFMNDVRLGSPDLVMTASLELDDAVLGIGFIPPPSGSPPASLTSNPDRKVTPPSSPNMNSLNISHNKEISEPLELQIDYWVTPGKQSDTKTDVSTKGKLDNTKSTLKSAFRSLQIARLSTFGEQPSSHFTLSYSTKEKKQKIMRLGKKKEKEKENEPKSQVVDGVYRLICSPKTQNIPLKLSIDGTEWTGVKFFQLSAQWQTHIRFFPVSLFSIPDNSTGWNFEPFLKNIEIL